MIQEAYCSKEVSELLKEKGFNERCRAFWKSWLDKDTLYECDRSQLFDSCYNEMLLKDYTFEDEKNIAAPTHQMAMDYLEEKYGIDIVCFHEKLPSDRYWCRIEKNLFTEFSQEPTYTSKKDSIDDALKYVLTEIL